MSTGRCSWLQQPMNGRTANEPVGVVPLRVACQGSPTLLASPLVVMTSPDGVASSDVIR